MSGRDADALLEAARDRDKNAHNRAVRELAELAREDPSALVHVVAAFAGPDARVRMAAARAFAAVHDESREPLAPLVHDADAGVRWAAARALAEGFGPREPQPVAVAPLLAAARDRVWTVRGFALWGLGKCPGEEPRAAVARGLRDDDPRVRRFAAFASGSVPELLAALDDPHGGVRWAAANALGRRRVREAVGPLSRRIRARDRSVRWEAARALGEIGGVEASAALRAVAARVQERNFRRHVESALRRAQERR